MSLENPKLKNEPGPDSMPEEVLSREAMDKFEKGPEQLEPDTIPEEKEFLEEEAKKNKKTSKLSKFKQFFKKVN